MNNKAFFKYIFALLLFGSNGIAASFIELSSLQIVLLRTCIGSLLLTALFFITGGSHKSIAKSGVEFNRRDIMRLCRTFKTADSIQPVLNHLIDYGYLAIKTTDAATIKDKSRR